MNGQLEIKEHIVTLSRGNDRWTKELNLVSIDDAEPQYDIREWSPDHKRYNHGISLTKEEANIMAAKIADRWIKANQTEDVNIIKFPKKEDIQFPFH